MDQNTNAREIDIDLGKIFYKMRNKFIIIAVLTVLAAIISGLITNFCIKPTYTAKVKMYVYANTDRVSTDSSITSNELDASQELVNTYLYILESDTVLESVIEDLDLKTTAGALRGAINAKQAENTVAFEVSVSSKDPKMSAKIANSVAKIAPSEIVRVVKAGGVEIIDYAKVPTRPSSPNLKKNVGIAALAVCFLSFLMFFVYEIFDTTITSERDVEGEFGIPILGTVPNLDFNNNNQSKSSGDKSKSINESSTVTINANKEDVLKPSNDILNSLQEMKGDGNNAQKK